MLKGTFRALVVAVIVLVVPTEFASAASISSAQSGPWSSTNTWTGGTIPGTGDVAIINQGHTVTINNGSPVTIGANLGSASTSPTIVTAAQGTTFNSTAVYYWIVARNSGGSAFTAAVASSPATLSPSSAQKVNVTMPVSLPANATGYDVYRGTTSTFTAASTVRVATNQAAGAIFSDTNISGDGTTGVSIGTLPTYALVLQGNLTMNDTLTVQGNFQMRAGASGVGAVLTQNGATLTLKTPDAYTTVIMSSVWNGSTDDKLTWSMSGVSTSSPAILQSSGPGVARVELGIDSLDGELINWQHFLVSGLGSNSLKAIQFYNRPGNPANSIVLSGGTVQNSGPITINNDGNSNDTFNFQNITFSGALQGYDITLAGGAGSTGTRILSGNVFDQSINLYGNDYTVTGNIFHSNVAKDGAFRQEASISNNLFAPPANYSFGTLWSAEGTENFSNNYAYLPQDNPHVIQMGSIGSNYPNIVVHNNVFETDLTSGTDNGDLVMLPTANYGTSTITNNIALTTGTYDSMMLSALGNALSKGQIINNNTLILNSLNIGCSNIGETYDGVKDLVASYRNNICSNRGGTASGYQVNNPGSGSVADTITDADYNDSWNLAPAGSLYHGLVQSAYTWGTHDAIQNPNFVDQTRALATWDATLGGPGTAANALAQLNLQNSTGYNSAYNIAALVAFVRAGFRPQNTALASAGSPSDGSPDIGAIPFAASTISSVASTTGATTAALTWSTDTPASSQIEYGLTNTFGATTTKTDASTRVTSHTTNLTGLVGCTTYYFRPRSVDVNTQETIGATKTFFTGGCSGSAPIKASASQPIITASGGSLSLSDGTRTLTLTVPVGASASSSLTYEANQIDQSAFFSGVTAPSGVTHAGNVYHLVALPTATSSSTSFLQPLTVTLSYTAADISGLTESSLVIERYDGSSWHTLTGCAVDTTAKTVTCSTSNFSDFSIFGTPSPVVASSGSGGNGGGVVISGPLSIGYQVGAMSATQPRTTTTNTGTTATAYQFTRSLGLGSKGSDVQKLQVFLNTHGFTVASKGAGSWGHETALFGSATKAALIRFQNANAQDILAPQGLKKGTGLFGQSTRTFINTLLQ